MNDDAVHCWEALDPGDPVLEQARRLYETTIDLAERIPWKWIADAVQSRVSWRPGGWSAHLLLAALGSPRKPVVGFAYGIHLPDYGGYGCYLGVDPRFRRRGVGNRLLRLLIRILHVDAGCEGAPLPFVVWESRAPRPPIPAEEQARWQARLRLFERVGARWISGLTFLAPNFSRRREPPVPLQLFLVPVETPAEQLDADALRGVAAGLMREVYGRDEGDPLFEQTLPPSCRPVLRPASDLRNEPPG
jgi:GNAT superfamily N-acetyltransferase